MNDSKLDLIAKLLAKAESTTPEEAEALTEHAERLMVKYGIEQALLDDRRARSGGPQPEVVHEKVVFNGAYARDIRELGANVALALGTVNPMYSYGTRLGTVLSLVGVSSDVQQAKTLITSLQVQATVAMRSWWLGVRDQYRAYSESDRRRARSGFIRGFGSGAAQRIRETRAHVVEEAVVGTELALISRKERVDAVTDEISNGHARRRQGADRSAYRHGHLSGQQADTGGARLEAV